MKNMNKFDITAVAILFAISTASAADQIKVFEMGESGCRVVFPLTSEEMTASNAENTGLAATKAANALAPKNRVEAFELAESGLKIVFPVPIAETEVHDSAIAGSISENEDPSI
jgi:hypothetical protein